MRILLIRHGDPDYIHDTLTEKGRREAALLAEAAPSLKLGRCFVSPLGRARDTAAYSLNKLSLNAQTCDWLQEFPAHIDLNKTPSMKIAYNDTKRNGDQYLPRILWDMLPSYWTEHPEYTDPVRWKTSDAAKNSDLLSVYDYVTKSLDKLLAEYGYIREGSHYRVIRESEETLTFFCHFGITAALLSHLWSTSPFLLWHSLALAPTSVTELVTEEREQGIAYFRGLRLGDISHLYAGQEPPSFAARFCETYSNTSQRH